MTADFDGYTDADTPELNCIGDRLDAVRNRILAACESVDRDPSQVTLVAISKGHSAAAIRTAYEAGCRDFGESYVQEAAEKIPWLPDDIRWHLVGHLQRNKAAEALNLFDVLHALDSNRLLKALANKLDAPEPSTRPGGTELPVLVQVNVSGEAAKYGVTPDDAGELVTAATRTSRVRPAGLMTLPPYSPDPEASRPVFKSLRWLRDQLQRDTGVSLPHLSMGMSGDYAIAVEEGATLVRVGTAIFGPRS